MAELMPATVSRPARRRNGSKHDKTGCLTCRYRRKKCTQNTFPACGDCIRLNLECVREPMRHVVPGEMAKKRADAASQRRSTIPQPLHKSPEPTILRNRSEGTSRRLYAMNYYITVLSELLTVSREYNSFLSAFLPMAVDSPALADALVAWSSGHLAATDGSYRLTALEARSTALRSLAETIASVPEDLACCEANVATCLVLLTSEVCLGDHTGWYCHLKGVKNMIQSARSSAQGTQFRGTDALRQSPEGQWILRNFAYHDILGSVTLGTNPLIKAGYLEGITGLVDTYLGVASEVLMYISEISCLDPPDLVYEYIDESDGSSSVLFGERSASLERRIKGWNCQPGTAPTLVAVAYAYRSAALIYLYRRILRALDNDADGRRPELSSILDPRIRIEVARTLENVSDVPLNDNPETALLFPVFMAGAEATERNHVEMVRMRLVIMQGKRPFHNISRGLQVLEELWTRRHSHCDVDWRDIVEQQPGRLLLT